MSLLYTAQIPSPSGDNSEEARSTVQPVRETAAPQVDVERPAAIVTDSTDELTGLASRAVPADHHPSQGASFNPDDVDYQAVDRAWATKGRAASLEAQGVWGHGTMQFDESISPIITGDEKLGGDMFSAERQLIQGNTGDFMTGVVVDNTYAAIAANAAQRNARKAYGASLYEGWTG